MSFYREKGVERGFEDGDMIRWLSGRSWLYRLAILHRERRSAEGENSERFVESKDSLSKSDHGPRPFEAKFRDSIDGQIAIRPSVKFGCKYVQDSMAN